MSFVVAKPHTFNTSQSLNWSGYLFLIFPNNPPTGPCSSMPSRQTFSPAKWLIKPSGPETNSRFRPVDEPSHPQPGPSPAGESVVAGVIGACLAILCRPGLPCRDGLAHDALVDESLILVHHALQAQLIAVPLLHPGELVHDGRPLCGVGLDTIRPGDLHFGLRERLVLVRIPIPIQQPVSNLHGGGDARAAGQERDLLVCSIADPLGDVEAQIRPTQLDDRARPLTGQVVGDLADVADVEPDLAGGALSLALVLGVHPVGRQRGVLADDLQLGLLDLDGPEAVAPGAVVDVKVAVLAQLQVKHLALAAAAPGRQGRQPGQGRAAPGRGNCTDVPAARAQGDDEAVIGQGLLGHDGEGDKGRRVELPTREEVLGQGQWSALLLCPVVEASEGAAYAKRDQYYL
ncbi:hypothetical protein PspLS_06676 [Pyricularia sp. CBS 133598]|nr:hypothetical protein PspLS_06676 [Pyricularia sp. CBS 133598]